MDIEYIKRFIAVGQCLNFSRAADMLFITQPTLSHSITALEKKLGAPLLVRNTKSVKLTRAGELFLPAAIEIVERYENVLKEISQELGHGGNVLNIGYIGPATDNIFTSWVKAFRKTCPDVKVQILRYSTSEIAEVFERRLIHLGFLYKMNAVNIPGLKFQDVNRETFKVCLNAEHPLAGRSKIKLTELKDEPFLICRRSTSPNYYDRVLNICEQNGYKPKISQEIALVGDTYRLVGAGLGVAIMSYSKTRSYDSYDIKFVDIDSAGDLENIVVVAWKDSLSPAARQFKDITQKSVSL